MATFNFKSSGKKISSRKYTNVTKSQTTLTPIGLKTPLQIIQNSEDLYQTHVSPENQLKDNIKNFLLTNHGERLGRYNFGANLSKFVFESSKYTEVELRQEILNQITNEISKNFSGIVITSLDVELKSNDIRIETLNTLEQTTVHKRNFKFEGNSLENNVASGLAKIIVLMTFSIPGLKLTNQKIETTIYVGG
jgi:hypothetical protein